MFNLIENQILLWNFNVHRNSTKYLNFKTTILEYYQKLTFSYHVCRTRAPSRISKSGILYKCLISYPLLKYPKHFCTQSFMLKHPITLADILKSAKNLMQHFCCNFFNAISFAEKFEINFAIRITWFLLRNMYYITYYTYISPNWSNLDYHQSDSDRVESVLTSSTVREALTHAVQIHVSRKFSQFYTFIFLWLFQVTSFRKLTGMDIIIYYIRWKEMKRFVSCKSI